MTKKFIRKDAHKKKRIANTSWRKPKGITNKMRLNRKGHPTTVRPGYGTPNKEKNTKQGLQIIQINNTQELEKINPKTQCIIIGRTGKQKKLELIKIAEEKKITIINLKINEYKKQTEEYFTERQKSQKQKTEKQKTKEQEQEKKNKEQQKTEEEKKQKQQELTEEEKQKQDKKEKDKILTKK